MLNIIGIGLSKEHLTDQIKELVKDSDVVYLENYTSVYDISVKELEKILKKKIILAERELVENAIEILEKAKTKNVSLLIIGDIFSATTHYSLYLDALKKKIKVNLVNNVSILTAVGQTGLFLYKFGKTTSIPFAIENKNIKEPINVLKMNQKNGLHTLFLLDLNPKENKFLTINQALKYLLEEKVINEDTLAVGCSALCTKNQEIVSSKVKKLINYKFKSVPQCLIIPGILHFIEEDGVNLWQLK
ncbi:MAG: diphthine synthase [Candidatus Nanoarchaeia archaeon]